MINLNFTVIYGIMKGGVLNDSIRYDSNHIWFQSYFLRICGNAYRIVSQRHSLMNAIR